MNATEVERALHNYFDSASYEILQQLLNSFYCVGEDYIENLERMAEENLCLSSFAEYIPATYDSPAEGGYLNAKHEYLPLNQQVTVDWQKLDAWTTRHLGTELDDQVLLTILEFIDWLLTSDDLEPLAEELYMKSSQGLTVFCWELSQLFYELCLESTALTVTINPTFSQQREYVLEIRFADAAVDEEILRQKVSDYLSQYY